MAEASEKKEKRKFLSRTVKWEIPAKPGSELERLLIRVSDGLGEYERWALDAQHTANEAYKKAVADNPEEKPDGKRHLSDFDLYSRYMPLRDSDAADHLTRASVPANWVLESCFRKIASAYKSFFELRKQGDRDARTPRPSRDGHFVAIQGALNPSSLKGDRLVLAPRIFPGQLEFVVPDGFQRMMLGRATRLAKFVITRDEPDLNRPGRYWVSVSYEIPLPGAVPFVPEQAVYIALGASFIGIVSPKGEEMIPLWRADTHWKPRTDAIETSLEREPSVAYPRSLKKGSKKWRKLEAKRRKMFRIMGGQQKLDRRNVAARDCIEHVRKPSKDERRFRSRHPVREGANAIEQRLLGHGVHFVVTELVVRSKEGALADSSKEERGGSLGLNWAAQNTGSIAHFAAWLESKVQEHGGSVRKHRLPAEALPESLPGARERKIPIARLLRDDFLRSLDTRVAA